MIPRDVVLRAFTLLVVLAATVEAQTPARIDQSELARRLLTGDGSERGGALARVRQMRPENVTPQLRSALITALEQESRLLAGFLAGRARGQGVPDPGNPELIAGLAHVVAAFRDPRSIPGLAGALGSSPPAMSALAEFGELAAPAVLQVVETTTDGSVEDDAMTTLRFIAERVGRSLTGSIRTSMCKAARERLTTPQKFVTTVWKAIDLAVAVDDAELRRVVQSLASDRNAVIALINTEPDLIDRTQRLASERLAGIPPRLRHTSVEEYSRRWE